MKGDLKILICWLRKLDMGRSKLKESLGDTGLNGGSEKIQRGVCRFTATKP